MPRVCLVLLRTCLSRLIKASKLLVTGPVSSVASTSAPARLHHATRLIARKRLSFLEGGTDSRLQTRTSALPAVILSAGSKKHEEHRFDPISSLGCRALRGHVWRGFTMLGAGACHKVRTASLYLFFFSTPLVALT
ncbi:hypothetical protein J3E68DRAFT_194713 [Trichoderma sp. SZMC 28012]